MSRVYLFGIVAIVALVLVVVAFALLSGNNSAIAPVAGAGAGAAAVLARNRNAIVKASIKKVETLPSRSYATGDNSDDKRIELDISEKSHDEVILDWKRERPGRDS